MENSTSAVSKLRENFRGPVIVSSKLFNLLSSVRKIELVTSVTEVLDCLKFYIHSRKLFDPQNQLRICCHGDELGAVLGIKEFTIYDVAKILPKFLFRVSSDVSSSSASQVCTKRKNEEEECHTTKRGRSDVMILQLPPSPTSNNLLDSEESCQGYETAVAKDTSDDSFYLSHVKSDDSEEDDDFSIVAVEEMFEYDVESLSSHSFSAQSDSDSDSDMDTLKSAVIKIISKSDSDMEFWADNSSEEEFFTLDGEVLDSDKLRCSQCGNRNGPACEECFHRQLEWFASEKQRRPKRKNQTKRKRASRPKTFTKEEPSNSSQSDVSENKIASSSQDSYSSECSTEPKVCLLCCDRPANGMIIHAHSKYAHMISCYTCAKKLKHQKKRCPVCRRRIHRVVCSVTS